ncbi:MAG: diacylglycerol kinase family lipid kinase [Sphingobacteriaceae bacterium]|nr:diacylglycerol kinase family lipid kinase [Sphingobacteriaceae bacterium]
MKKNILFVINPISGGKSKKDLPTLIHNFLNLEKFNPSYVFTEYEGHATELTAEALKNGIDIAVAVGGDGTINEVATAVVKTDKILGIIPLGSGNGLARFLKIPLSVKSAIEVINQLKTDKIDTALLNDKPFFNMAGVGFDAHISHVFAGNSKRGLSTYIKLGFSEILDYKPQAYQINIDGVDYHQSAFAISIANSSQYGNNVHISPLASVKDGWLDVCIIKPFELYKMPLFAMRVLVKNAEKSNMLDIIKAKKIQISMAKPSAIHLDGEPSGFTSSMNIEIKENSLNVLIP